MKKGFTLIELLAVIVILAVISLIAVPIIFDLITDSKEKAKEISYQNIEHATDLYVRSEYDINGIKYPDYVSLQELVDKGYLTNTEEDLNNKVFIITNFDEYKSDEYLIYYEGRNKSKNFKTLKELIKSDKEHIKKDVVINGHTVDKVYGTDKETLTMKNYVLFSGQLMEVLEINNESKSIKLVSAVSLTEISYGSTNDWESSWVRKWLNEEFYQMLERKDLIKDTTFCVDNVDDTPDSYTKMNKCSNEIIEKVGLLTYEDYIYAKDGLNINNGGNFLSDPISNSSYQKFYTMTPTSIANNSVWYTDLANPGKLIVGKSSNKTNVDHTTNTYGLGIRPVISISDDILVKSGKGTREDPYILSSERSLSKNEYLNLGKVGDYVYMDESNNPYVDEIDETIIKGIIKKTSTSKVRYRIVSINEDGTVKLERVDVLRNLPDTISSTGVSVPFYSIDGGSAETSCLYSTNNKYGTDFDNSILRNKYFYIKACDGHQIFNPEEGSGDFERDSGENIGFYLNNADNSFYNWYSDKSKKMIEKTKFNVRRNIVGVNYTVLKDDDTIVLAYIGLPGYGQMYTGNDLNSNLYLTNPQSVNVINYIGAVGSISNTYLCGNAAIRPVITLKKDVVITSGDGTVNNPYTLNI